jgi:hypothetical protein
MITTRDDALLFQAIESVVLEDSLNTRLNPAKQELACRRYMLAAYNVPLTVAADTEIFKFDPFTRYFNHSLAKNSSLSTFSDVYFDLKITVTVISLPAYAGFLRFYFSRFHQIVEDEPTRNAFEHFDLDLSNKEYLEFTLTMELPYRLMNTKRSPFVSYGVGSLVAYAPLQITSPEAAGANIRVEVYGEPINLRPFNLIPRFLTPALQTALQPMEAGVSSDITWREPVANRLSPFDVAKHWGFAKRVTVPTTVTTTAPILLMPLNPASYKRTPLGELTNLYSFFRGSMKFRLTINLNKFQNVQLAAAFVPAGSTIDSVDYDACAYQDFTFDQAHVHEFEIEYAAGSQWLPSRVSSANASESFGNLCVFMRSPVISVTPPAAQPSLLVEVAAGSTFELAYPRDHLVSSPQPPVVQALNSEVPIRSVSASTNLYSDATLPSLVDVFSLKDQTKIVYISPRLAQSGLLQFLTSSHAAWRGALEFIIEFLEPSGALEIRYDPLLRKPQNLDYTSEKHVPTTGFTLFAAASVNRIFRFKVPFTCIYDYLCTFESSFSSHLDMGLNMGALLLLGQAHFKLYIKAADDFEVLFYNSFSHWTSPASIIPPSVEAMRNKLTPTADWPMARPQAGWGQKLGIDTEEINSTVSEVKSLVSSLKPLVHAGTNVMDVITSLLEGPGKIFTAAFNMASLGLEGLKTVVLNMHTFIQTFLEIVTPSYIWSFLKNATDEAFSPEELLVLYGVVVVAGACALDVTNPSFIVLALITFGLATPALISITSSLAETLLSDVAAPAVKASLKVESSSTITCVVTILTTLLGLLIPSAKGNSLFKLGAFAKDFSSIFSGAKVLEEIFSSLLSVILQSPVICSALGCDFAGVSLALSVDLEAYVNEVRALLLDDFMNKGITHEMIVNQERLTKIRREIETKLPKVDKTNFFFNTTLRKVMDEQEKMHRHVKAHRGHAKERFSPFTIMIHGQTRVGKSVLAAHLQEQFCELMNWDVETDVYTRQNNDKFFSGLGHQKILYIDDAHTNINADGADSDMATIMAFVTNAPWAPPMASLEDKGRCVTALIGMFVTNTPGVPTYAGVRNPEAYLARRNLLVKMRWKRDAADYQTDFSHAEFILNDPMDPNGSMCFDADWNSVRETDPNVWVLSYADLWKLCATQFVEHMVEQRRLRAERKSGSAMPAPVDDDLLAAVRKMCDHFDDLDAIPLDKFLPQAATQAGKSEFDGQFSPYGEGSRKTTAEMLHRDYQHCTGSNVPRYAAIYELFGDRVLKAVGDIYYLPRLDTFVWKGEHLENKELYYALLEVASGTPEEDLLEHFEDVATAIADEPSSEIRDEMLLACSNTTRPLIKRRVERILHIRETMADFGGTGTRTFWGELARVNARIPRWFKILLLAAGTGGFVYHMLRKKNPYKRLSAEPSVAPPQYQKDLAPALAMPVKKMVVPLAPPQYEKDLAPAMSMPLKKALVAIDNQYERDLSPSMSLPVKKRQPIPPQYERELAPSLTMPVKKSVLSDYAPAARPRPLDNPPPLAKPQSAAELEEAQKQVCDKVCTVWRSGATQNGFLLDDRHVLVNRHFICCAYPPLLENELYQFKYEVSSPEITQCYLEERNLAVEDIWPVGQEDFCILKLKLPLPRVSKGWGHLVTERQLTALYPTTGILITRSPKFKSVIHSLYPVKRMLRASKETFINLDGAMNVFNPSSIFVDGYTYRAVTSDGSCGGPLILEGTGGKVCGLHGAGFVTPDRSGECLAHLLYLEMIQTALKERGSLFFWNSNPRYAEPAPIYNARLDALNALFVKAQVCIDVAPYGLEVVGVTDMSVATRGSMHTSFRPSPISRFFPFEPFRVPAILSPKDSRAPYEYDPRVDILGKYTRQIKPLDHTRLMRVVDHLAAQMTQLYHPYKPTGLLTFTESIDGVPGAPFYDAINMHSSPGIPFSFQGHHKKASMFVHADDYVDGSPHYLPISPVLEARYDCIVSNALQGNMVEVLFQEFMKDELVKRGKVFEKPATRGIANPPLDLLLAVRSAFLPFIALCMFNRHSIDCQVGINPMSGLEWTAIVNRLQGNSDLVFDADYSAFDSTIHGSTLDAFAELANKVMGGTFQEQLARKVLVRYTYDRVSQVTDVQVKINQGMASGMPITAVGNSIVNMFYLRYAWLKLAEKVAPEFASLRFFDENVKAIVYGDDNMVTVKPSCASWYNLKTIAQALAEYGIVMTDGAKNSGDKIKPFGSWAEMRFLKRAFVLDHATGMYLAPLEMKTILDRIRYVKSKTWVVDLDMRCQASLVDAVMHGKESFTALQYFINDCYAELDLVPYTFEYEFERGQWESAGRLAVNQMLKFSKQDPATNYLLTYTAPIGRHPTTEGLRYLLELDPPTLVREAGVLDSWQCAGTRPSSGSSLPSTSQGGGVTREDIRSVVNAVHELSERIPPQVNIQADLRDIASMIRNLPRPPVSSDSIPVELKRMNGELRALSELFSGWKTEQKVDEILTLLRAKKGHEPFVMTSVGAGSDPPTSKTIITRGTFRSASTRHEGSSSSLLNPSPSAPELPPPTFGDFGFMVSMPHYRMLFSESTWGEDHLVAFFGFIYSGAFTWSLKLAGTVIHGCNKPFNIAATGALCWVWWDWETHPKIRVCNERVLVSAAPKKTFKLVFPNESSEAHILCCFPVKM